jgi:hypothetical protein
MAPLALALGLCLLATASADKTYTGVASPLFNGTAQTFVYTDDAGERGLGRDGSCRLGETTA